MVKIPVDGKITFFFQIVEFFFKHGGENSFKKDFQFFFQIRPGVYQSLRVFVKAAVPRPAQANQRATTCLVFPWSVVFRHPTTT